MYVSANSRSLRNLVVITSIVIASSIIGLALLEGMVRFFYPAYDPSGQVEFVVGPDGLTLGPMSQTKRQRKNTGDFDVSIQFNARGFFQEVEHSELGRKIRYPGHPYQHSLTPARIRQRPPLIGEHNEEIVCGELGLSAEQFASYAPVGGY